MRRRNAGLFALVVITGLPLGAGSQLQPSLYTALQAQSGEALYASKCAACHGERFRVGPPLTGSRVTVGDVFRYARRHMPMQSAFALSDEQYVLIMAAILQQNGFPPGSTPLTYAAAYHSTAAFPVNAPQSAPKR
jgi:mono/diheme cytochrome c family protein